MLWRGTYSEQDAASNVADSGSSLLHVRPHHAIYIIGDVSGHEVNGSHIGEVERMNGMLWEQTVYVIIGGVCMSK